MKKSLFLVLAFLSLRVGAQQAFHCGTPSLSALQNKAFVQSINVQRSRMPAAPIIPVVFHVLSDGGYENISDAQILDALSILNDDFDYSNADSLSVEPVFQSVVSNPNIQFKLATIDPYGNCTNGIDRITTTLTNMADDCSKLNQWDPAHYLNIWTVKSIGSIGVAEYTYLPSTAALPAFVPYDGILMLHDYVGSIGTSGPTTSRALTHSVGHYLGLDHMGTICDDLDGIADTPPTDGSFYCHADSSCSSSVHENFENFMAYSFCSKMFTSGQVAVMNACLSSPIANRDQLCTPANLAATGVLAVPGLCAPKPDFSVNRKMNCVSNSFSFTDLSSLGAPTAWNWTFTGPGGSTTSALANPVMTFSTPGSYQVSLNVSNASGSATRTKPEYFWASSGISDFLGLSVYGYEDSVDFYSLFPIFNLEENNTSWRHCAYTSYSGFSSVMLNAFGSCGADKDELITGSYDLSGMSALYFSFWYSGAVTDTALANGVLRVSTSIDCGATWTQRRTFMGAEMAPAGLHTSSFVPSSASEWVQHSVTLPSSCMTSDVRFKLSYTNGPGANNIFIDDIETMHMVGIDESAQGREGKLSPNPAKGDCAYELELNPGEKGMIRIFEPTGKLVSETGLSESRTMLSTAGLASGIYFFKVIIDGKEVDRKKLVVP
jgi:PKD repeat protein